MTAVCLLLWMRHSNCNVKRCYCEVRTLSGQMETACRSWMRVADDRARWREIGEAYVQQWTVVGWWWLWCEVRCYVIDTTNNNKYGSVTTLKQWPNQTYISWKSGLQIMSSASLVGNFSWNQTSISYVYFSIKLNFNQQTSIWKLVSDAYFECTSCYCKVVTLFVRNLFRVRIGYRIE
jgi:hypothetical protein